MLSEEDACEAGIFGILGGNLRLALPLCTSWHDQLWAHARCWLETALDALLEPSNPSKSVSPRASDLRRSLFLKACKISAQINAMSAFQSADSLCLDLENKPFFGRYPFVPLFICLLYSKKLQL